MKLNRQWAKLGRIFAADGRYDWMLEFAQIPRVLPMADRLRIYFSCRGRPDKSGLYESHTAYLDVDPSNLTTIIGISETPVMTVGAAGTFDCHGVMPGTAIRFGNELRMYYTGWNRTQGVPYNQAIGMAVSEDEGKTFRRTHSGPVLGRSRDEGFLQNGPFVMEAHGLLHMWYSSGVGWRCVGDRMESVYVVMHATSEDGLTWSREGVPCLPSTMEDECQNCPSVAFFDGKYHMWFCYRSAVNFRNPAGGYRLGYAVSDDLGTWRRNDEEGRVPLSESGWDSEMICYPWVHLMNGVVHLFYCGNEMGRAGFGVATATR